MGSGFVNDYFGNDNGDVFIQPDGPGTDTYYIPCLDMGDLAAPKGDINRELCPDPHTRGKSNVAYRSQGQPGEVTFDLTVPLGRTANRLEEIKCPTPFYRVIRECGDRTLFLPFDRADVLVDGALTNETDTNTVSARRDGAAATGAMETFSLTSAERLRAFSLHVERQTTVEPQNIMDVAFYKVDQCAGPCGPAVAAGMRGMAVSASAVGPDVSAAYYTANGGATWTLCAAIGFAAGESASCVEVVERGSVLRWIVGAGTTAAGAPAHIRWSEDNGATWTAVNVGATNGEFFPASGCIFALDGRHIWAVTDQAAVGNIYFSNDYGATWTLQLVTTDEMMAVHFLDENFGVAVGQTNDMFATEDGGSTWATITGPAAEAAVTANTVAMATFLQWYVGYADGTAWMTQDGGTTWSQLALTLPAGGAAINAVNEIKIVDRYALFAAIQYTDTAAGVWACVERSIAGGGDDTWETFVAPVVGAAPGMLAVEPININEAFACGCISGALGTLVQISKF